MTSYLFISVRFERPVNHSQSSQDERVLQVNQAQRTTAQTE